MMSRGRLDVNLPLVDAYVIADQPPVQPPNTGNCVGTPVSPGIAQLYVGNVGTPILNYIGSPSSRVESPSRNFGSPSRRGGSPSRRTGSPSRRVGSPGFRTGSPSRRVDSDDENKESRPSTAKTVKFEVTDVKKNVIVMNERFEKT